MVHFNRYQNKSFEYGNDVFTQIAKIAFPLAFVFGKHSFKDPKGANDSVKIYISFYIHFLLLLWMCRCA